MSDGRHRRPGIGEALVPVVVLIFLLSGSVYLFGSESSGGPNQIALIVSACVGIIAGLKNGYGWKELEKGIVHGISLATSPVLILLVVGSLIGTWILAGVVPTMIFYGLKVLEPSIFYAASCVICAVVALATGSSWTTAGTIGVALVGIASAQNLNLGMAAGAIISGAYFGDKMSPLSDTTNLSPAMAGSELFVHIRHMLWTTTPSLLLALVLFSVLGFFGSGVNQAPDLESVNQALTGHFQIGLHLLLPPAAVIVLVIRRMPALPALLIGTFLGGVFAVLFQAVAVLNYVNEPGLGRVLALVKGCWMVLFQGFALNTGNEVIDSLLTRGGMASMLDTVWLVMSAMMFGAVMETTGMLERIGAGILGMVRGTGSLILATLSTSIGMNIIASDQYISIVLPGRMFRAEYRRRGLDPKNLSRTLEDGGTLTSPLVPWSTCGAFMAQTLMVPTLSYLPYCFLNLINPVIAAIYGFTGFTIEKLPEGAQDEG